MGFSVFYDLALHFVKDSAYKSSGVTITIGDKKNRASFYCL